MRKIIWLVLIASSLVGQTSWAFSIEDPPILPFPEEPVHEDITRATIERVGADLGVVVSEMAMNFILTGTVNPDRELNPHKKDPDVNDYHVNNATRNNGQFESSFNLLRSLLIKSIALSQENSRVLAPLHADIQPFMPYLANACRLAPAPCLDLAPAGILSVSFPYFVADPHVPAGQALVALGERLPELIAGIPRRSQNATTIEKLEELKLELDGYLARQLLGHAFHLSQDMFAHSNFIELVNGRNGPPCGSLQNDNPAICDERLVGFPRQFGDTVVGPFLERLGRGFDFTLDTFLASLDASQARRLQTGNVKVSLLDLGDFCPDKTEDKVPSQFNYCHGAGSLHPALNKDKPGSREPSHANHPYARRLSEFASEILWAHYLREAGFASALTAQIRPQLFSEGTKSRARVSLQGSGADAGRGISLLQNSQRITLSLPQPTRVRVGFRYRIQSMGEATGGQNCDDDSDFITYTGQGFFDAGTSSTTIPLTICPDSRVEPDPERLRVTITGRDVVSVTQFVRIVDDDRRPVPVLRSVTSLARNNLILPGTSVRLAGSGFVQSSRVEVDGSSVTPMFVSARELRLVVPRKTASGSRRLRVVTPDGGISRTLSMRVVALTKNAPIKKNADAKATARLRARARAVISAYLKRRRQSGEWRGTPAPIYKPTRSGWQVDVNVRTGKSRARMRYQLDSRWRVTRVIKIAMPGNRK